MNYRVSPFKRPRQRGTVMIMVVILATVMSGLVLTIAWAGGVQAQITRTQMKLDKAFYASESGAQLGAWMFKHDNTFRRSTNNPYTGSITMGNDSFSYTITCSDNVGTANLAWKFDEGTGTTTADSTGNNNTGTLHGGCTWTTDSRSGKALSFDGSTGYVDCGNGSSTNLVGDITFSAWVKMAGAASDQKIGANENGSFGGYKLCVYNSKVEFEVRDASNAYTLNRNQPGGTTLVLGSWYHVVGEYSETNHWIKTYVNGKEEVSRRLTGTASNALGSTTGTFIIGREPFNAALYFWNGKIDDVRIFHRCLSDAEVQSLYDTTVDIRCVSTTSAGAVSGVTVVTAGIPTPPPPTAPTISIGGDYTLKGVTISGDLQVSGDVDASGTGGTVDGNILYGGTYSSSKITLQNGHTAQKQTNSPPTIDYTAMQAQAGLTYNSAQSGTTFDFGSLGGNKVIYVNGNVTDPKFTYTGSFPSGGTLLINGTLKFTSACAVGTSTYPVYLVVMKDCQQSNNAATLTLYGGLYVDTNWAQRSCSVTGVVSVKGTINDQSSTTDTFNNGPIPWFDPRATANNSQATLPMYYLNFHDDNP